MAERDPLESLRKLLDPKNWPVKPGEYMLHKGEVYWFVPSDDPLEERLCKPLFWRFQ